ncbi:MAG: penicillin-binding protein activator [Hyphomicrobiales bacterium]|nr:penicillin-binding protein activator [Hyphomicrobiales bacterium]
MRYSISKAWVVQSRSKALRLVSALGITAALAACSQIGGMSNPFGGSDRGPAETAGPLPAATSGTTLGTGPVRIALLVPLTQNGAPFVVGQSLKNAAELAIADTGGTSVTLLVKDTGGTAGGARAAAQTAVQEGAQMVLGPLFAGSVRAVGSVARSAGRPVIAFSTDTSVAARRVYLLSFLVENYVDRIVGYARSKGKRSIGALVPRNTYGNVALAELQQSAARRGIRIAAVERYSPGGGAAAAQRIARAAGSMDALFIPEQAQAMPAISSALIAAGISPDRVLVMGTGLWNDARAMSLPLLQGAVFAAPENSGFSAFADRYRARFNNDPIRIATLAYDAVTLAVALAGQQSREKFPENILTNPSGFNGADGLFRFRTDGTNQRGLAVLEINKGTTSTVSPAPRSFSGRS